MSGEHRIEFDAGEVIRPEFSPENDLVAIYVNDGGLESLREAVSEPQPPGSSGEDGSSGGVEGAAPLDSAVLDIGMAVIEMNAYVPEDIPTE